MSFYRFIIKAIASCLFVGYLPLIPGTFGSLGGLWLFYLSRNSFPAYLTLTISIAALGFWVDGPAERVFGRKDCRKIVIDEVSGMLASFLFIPYSLFAAGMGFLVFRILDALKPYPAGRMERLPGGAGVMADDLAAAVYTNLVLQLALRLVSLSTS